MHLSSPAAGALRGVCVVLPPVGYPYLSAYATLRRLAEKLAEHGVATLRLDYHGTGNSAGTGLEPDRPLAWELSVHTAYDALREATDLPLGVIGFGLGGLLATRLPRARDWTVLWEPPPSGRRFVSGARLLGQPVPETEAPLGGGVSFGGFPFSAATLGTIESWARADPTVPLGEVLVLGDASATRVLTGHLAGACASLTVRSAPTPSFLQRAAEEAVVPYAEIDEVVEWIGDRLPEAEAEARPLVVPGARDHAVPEPGVTERVVRVGRSALHAVAAAPDEHDASEGRSVVTVFLNSGSEMNIGSGRAWLDYSRALAATGHESLRLDWSGWGESPADGAAPGRPYDPRCTSETEQVVDALNAEGMDVVLVGLCAGAWVALKVALTRRLAGVVALNPQLYWREGDPVEALITDTSTRRAPTRRREELGARWGLWSALDLVGLRNREGAWLSRLSRSEFPIHLVFAEGDEGLLYLQNRLSRRTARVTRAGSITLGTVPGIDHSMHRLWLRGPVREAIIGFVREREHERGL